VAAGAHFVTALQTIVSRSLDPLYTAVVTVGKFAGGSAANIIPDKVELQGTLRSFSGDVRELIIGRLNELIAGLRTTFRVET